MININYGKNKLRKGSFVKSNQSNFNERLEYSDRVLDFVPVTRKDIIVFPCQKSTCVRELGENEWEKP